MLLPMFVSLSMKQSTHCSCKRCLPPSMMSSVPPVIFGLQKQVCTAQNYIWLSHHRMKITWIIRNLLQQSTKKPQHQFPKSMCRRGECSKLIRLPEKITKHQTSIAHATYGANSITFLELQFAAQRSFDIIDDALNIADHFIQF